VDSYLAEIQEELRGGKLPSPYKNKTFWVQEESASFVLQLGHVSDLAGGPSLYVVKGIDKNGLAMYRCCRGTSSVEGAVHMNIIRKFASYNAGPRLTDMVLADYRLYHNLDAGSKNRHGKLYKSH
jgi:hypothetical protein